MRLRNLKSETRKIMSNENHNENHEEPKRKRGDRWVLLLIFLLFLFGLAVRGYSYMNQPETGSGTFRQHSSPDYAQKALPGTSGGAQSTRGFGESEENDLLFDLAPYLTEGGLSFFIGFCLGFFLRFVAKTTIFVVGGLYFCLILLSHYGLVTVDWGGIQELLRHVLLNTQTQLEGLRGTMAVGIPSMALGGLGIWRGLKKK